MAEHRTLLAVFAHPDDEAFGTGGTLARYAGEGVRVALVCATRGEAGAIADPSLATPETLGQVREAELRCAAQAVGISEVIFLGYRDSGMAGTPENEDPRAFVNAPAEEVVPRLRRQYTFENEHWVFFGYGTDWEPGRCDRCYRQLYRTLKPPPEAINCWKLEIFFSNCTDVEAVKQYLLEESRRDPTLHGKWLKRELEIPREKLTSLPAAGHPDPDIRQDGAILIYTTSIAERDARRAKILADLKARGLYRQDAISARRGCVNFDEIIGPWQEWYDLEHDYPDREEADGV